MGRPVDSDKRDTGRESGRRFVAQWTRNAEHLARHGLYDPSDEKDACGVGLVVAVDGSPRREVVSAGIEALRSVWHRGAVDADGKTGDGAGIHVEIARNTRGGPAIK
jgi:glutamate synthase (NADPH/NADH) large chain